jgi:hypothetical protein
VVTLFRSDRQPLKNPQVIKHSDAIYCVVVSCVGGEVTVLMEPLWTWAFGWMGAADVLITLGALTPHPGPLPVKGRGWWKRLCLIGSVKCIGRLDRGS